MTKPQYLNVLPLCCFPPIHWVVIALRANTIIDVHEHYVKQTYRNRFDLLGVNGKITLTIPVQGQKGVKTPFHEIQIADSSWRKLHLTTIRSAYGRAAFFEHYIDELEALFQSEQTKLQSFNLDVLNWIVRCGIPMNIVLSTTHIESAANDFRNAFEPSSDWPQMPSYPQVFSDRFAFVQNLSVLDLLMNKGSGSLEYLQRINTSQNS